MFDTQSIRICLKHLTVTIIRSVLNLIKKILFSLNQLIFLMVKYQLSSYKRNYFILLKNKNFNLVNILKI